jgi:hypothetical protein
MRYTDNKNDTITDSQTGLMWSTENFGPVDWRTAAELCGSLHLANHQDWRLPTIEELRTLINYKKHMLASFYWSSTTYADNNSAAWGMNFTCGYDYGQLKSSNRYFRAVRGTMK